MPFRILRELESATGFPMVWSKISRSVVDLRNFRRKKPLKYIYNALLMTIPVKYFANLTHAIQLVFFMHFTIIFRSNNKCFFYADRIRLTFRIFYQILLNLRRSFDIFGMTCAQLIYDTSSAYGYLSEKTFCKPFHCLA